MLKKKGLHRISIDIGDNCSGGCQFSVQLAAARQTSLVGTEIPTSIEFDPMVPQSFKTGYTTVRYENEVIPELISLVSFEMLLELYAVGINYLVVLPFFESALGTMDTSAM